MKSFSHLLAISVLPASRPLAASLRSFNWNYPLTASSSSSTTCRWMSSHTVIQHHSDPHSSLSSLSTSSTSSSSSSSSSSHSHCSVDPISMSRPISTTTPPDLPTTIPSHHVKFIHHLKAAGFDIIHPFDVQWYNNQVEQKIHLPSFSRSSTQAFLVGNSLNLWPHFLKAKETQYKDSANPLDEWSRDSILAAAQAHFPPHLKYECRYPWDMRSGYLISFQRLSHHSGLCFLDTNTQLGIHPTYGPWLAFRGVVVIDEQYDVSYAQSTEHPSAVPSCPTLLPVSACEVAGCASLHKKLLDVALQSGGKKNWLKLRLICRVGKQYRYSIDQLAYHYHMDPKFVKEAIEEVDQMLSENTK